MSTKKMTKKELAATLKRLDAKAWRIVSEAVRLDGAYEDMGGTGLVNRCFTCDAEVPVYGGKLHAGHFFDRDRYKIVKFEKDNIRPQCFRCNRPLSGHKEMYAYWLGEQKICHLHDKIHAAEMDYWEPTIGYYQTIIDTWYYNLVELKAQLGMVLNKKELKYYNEVINNAGK